MCVLLPLSHRLARRRRLRLEDISEDRRIELGRRPAGPRGRVYLARGEEADLEPRVAFRSDDFNVVQGMVAAGAGVAVVPELALDNLRRDVVVRSLGSSTPMRTVVAAILAGVHRSPATMALLELLAEVSSGTGRRSRRATVEAMTL